MTKHPTFNSKSNEPTWPKTQYEYGLRFNIEEGFPDQNTNGLRWSRRWR